MNHDEKRTYLIEYLLREQMQYADIQIPDDADGQMRLLRSLMNVRTPAPIGEDFLKVQDEFLKEETRRKGITDIEDLEPAADGIYIRQGDITTLRCGAIVNAANSGMTGCYIPCHNCIDNCIHTFAGVQLRNACADIMRQQGYDEPTGTAKITPAYNLPCDYVIHTVGPIVQGELTRRHEEQLASCYRSCLDIAEANAVKSIAFCCISTGVFMFPNRRAAEIAVQAVRDWLQEHDGTWKVVFNVFKDIDLEIYDKLLNR